MKYFLVESDEFQDQVVAVSDEQVWEDTKRYLEDCGIAFKATDVRGAPVNPQGRPRPIEPGELSDLWAPRD